MRSRLHETRSIKANTTNSSQRLAIKIITGTTKGVGHIPCLIFTSHRTVKRRQTRVHLVSESRHVIRPDAARWWVDIWKFSANINIWVEIDTGVRPYTSFRFHNLLLQAQLEAREPSVGITERK